MKKIVDTLLIVPMVLFLIVFTILSLPIVIISLPFRKWSEHQYNEEYKEYLTELEGKNFFCYNNRKKGRACIEKEIIPYLPKAVEVIFLNGRSVEPGPYDARYLSSALYRFENYTRFPHLLKIRNGQAIDISLNAELFEFLNQKSPKYHIDNKINDFFELNNETSNS